MIPRVGMVLYGYCDGRFGRDSYGEKRIEAIGADWLVVRDGDSPDFIGFKSYDELEAFVERNSQKPADYDEDTW